MSSEREEQAKVLEILAMDDSSLYEWCTDYRILYILQNLL